MKLKCKIGSISCDGVLAKAGEIFEVSDEAGASIVADGYATTVDARGEDSVTKLVQDSIASDIDKSTDEIVGSTRFDGDITDESGVMREDAIPDASWVVADIKTWLDDRGIKYSNSATKTELLSLVDPGE